MAAGDIVIEHPNREKSASKLTRWIVVALLLVSALILAIISIGAWDQLVGAKALQVIYIALYAMLAFFVARWSRGVLPVAAALAIVLCIFALVSVPGWYERDRPGFSEPALSADVVGLLCALLVPLQILLIVFAMRGFQQAWNVEVERPAERRDRGERGGPDPAPAPA